MRERKVSLRAFKVDVPLVETGTKHLAIRVCYGASIGIWSEDPASPAASSINEDLFVYYSEEAEFNILTEEPQVVGNDGMVSEKQLASFGPRGVRAGDHTGELRKRRFGELAYVIRNL